MLLNLFISYAQVDRPFRDELANHLSTLRRQEVIRDWFDGDVTAGSERWQAVRQQLQHAHLILLLVSADFLASDVCYSQEMRAAMHRHEARKARVVPILVRPTDWQGAPFAKLAVLPSNRQPVSLWSNHDEAWLEVVQGIRRVIDDLLSRGESVQGKHVPGSEPQALWNVQLPRNPYFTGREEVLKHLHSLLTKEKTAAVSQPLALSGLGGIGKTQTAVEYAYRYRKDYQYVLWVQANTRETLLADFVSIAHLLTLPESSAQDQNETIEAVKRWFAQHTGWLLIFDNADDVSRFDAFLPAVSSKNSGHVLFTTRSAVMAKRARRVEVDEMSDEEGTLFLLRRASILAPNAPLTSAS